jgi:GNAT superfamily N-acetyltransferase
MLPAMSRDEILREIIERPREAYVPMPDLQVIVRPGWRQLLTPSVKGGGFNDVSLCTLTEDNVEATIDATIAQYREVGCKFVWRVGPDSTPRDLPERLARRGGTHTVSCGMARSTEMSNERDPRIAIDLVDASTVDDYTRTMAAGWNMDESAVSPAHRIIAGMREAEHPPTFHLFLARWDGEPAATASSVVFARSVYLIGGVTIEAFRGKGLYRALVAARMQHARARGVPLATSLAREGTSAPILERLGFEALFRMNSYSFDP